jgi:hypothetical protein
VGKTNRLLLLPDRMVSHFIARDTTVPKARAGSSSTVIIGLKYNALARNVKIAIQCNIKDVNVMKLVATLPKLGGVSAHLTSQI